MLHHLRLPYHILYLRPPIAHGLYIINKFRILSWLVFASVFAHRYSTRFAKAVMTARTGLLNNQRGYGVNDIGAVLSPSSAQDEVFSLLDIEDVLDPPDFDGGRTTYQYEVSLIPSLDVVDVSDMTDSTVSEDEEDYINCWNPYCKCSRCGLNHPTALSHVVFVTSLVYQLQQQAPSPRCVPCTDPVSSCRMVN